MRVVGTRGVHLEIPPALCRPWVAPRRVACSMIIGRRLLYQMNSRIGIYSGRFSPVMGRAHGRITRHAMCADILGGMRQKRISHAAGAEDAIETHPVSSPRGPETLRHRQPRDDLAPVWSRQAAHPGSVGPGHWRAPPCCFSTDGPRYGEFSMIHDMLSGIVRWRRRGEPSARGRQTGRHVGLRASGDGLQEKQVRLFSRTLDNITDSFPELVGPLSDFNEVVILDGEILAWREGRALPFAELQKLDADNVMQTYGRLPVAFVRGEGTKLWDSEGKEYIDCAAAQGYIRRWRRLLQPCSPAGRCPGWYRPNYL